MKKLLLLTPILGLFFTCNCFATQHNYDKLFTPSEVITPPLLQDSTGLYYDFNSNTVEIASAFHHFGSSLQVGFPYSWDDTVSPYSNQFSYYLGGRMDYVSRDGSVCSVSTWGTPSGYKFLPIWIRDRHQSTLPAYDDTNYISYRTRPVYVAGGFNPSYFDSSDENIVADLDAAPCFAYNYSQLGYSFSFPQFAASWYTTDWLGNTSSFGRNPLGGNKIEDYNGLSLSQSTTRQGSGVTFDTDFSFSRLFSNTYLPYVRYLNVPLGDIDGFFLKRENLYQGRQFEWHFSLYFSGTLQFGNSEDLYARIEFRGYPVSGSYPNVTSVGRQFECTMSTIGTGDSQTSPRVDFVCPVTLDTDYAGFWPYFTFGNTDDDSYFFHTDNEWFFSGAYLVTDNDYTPGDSFNSQLNGDSWGVYNGTPYDDSQPDWLTSLTRLFSFGLPVGNTPLGLILGGFSNQESCASIPTIAGMIHSNETQVCPFFPATVRAITTPVLGLFSICLVFGAFMSWLGGSSGNFIEDSSTHTVGGFKIAKGGKK